MSRSHLITIALLALLVPPLVFGNVADIAELLTGAAILGGGGLVLLIAAVAMGARNTDVAERTRTVHIDAGSWEAAARHEAGHIGNTHALGGRVPRSRIYPNGTGYADCVLPYNATPAMDIAVSLAGGTREGVNPWTAPQCSGDRALIRQTMGTVPYEERAAVRKEAMKLRHRGLYSGLAARAERQLLEKGTI